MQKRGPQANPRMDYQLHQEPIAIGDCPNLTLNLNQATVPKPSSGKISGLGRHTDSTRAKSARYPKDHHIVQKDYYRHMKTDKLVSKHMEKQKAKEMGRATNKSILDIKNSRYQPIGEVISEQYARSQIPENRLYMIDKVVRMRSQHGRFGIDHSELLNYELEQTNKPRDDYMNLLVYKDDAQTTNARDLTQIAPPDASVSQVLFHRLQCKDEERYSDYSQRELFGYKEDQQTPAKKGGLFGPSGVTELRRYGGSGLSYADWLKRKDAEKRMKRKLVG